VPAGVPAAPVSLAVLALCVVALLPAAARSAERPRPEPLPTADPVSDKVLAPFRGHAANPAEYGLAHEVVQFPNLFGQRLVGWFLDRKGSDRTVLVCGGNTGNMTYMLPYAAILHEAGCDVLLFDYQGFGDSAGAASVLSLPGDAKAAMRYLRQDRGLERERIGVLGVSLGSVLAAMLAAQDRPRAVAVEDLFLPSRHVEESAESVEGAAARGVLTAFRMAVLPMVDPLSTLPSYDGPLLLVHGEDDWMLPPSSTVRAAAATRGPTRVWILDDVGHAPEPLVALDREYAWQLGRFFDDAFEGRPLDDPQVSLEELPGSRLAVELAGGPRAPVQIAVADEDGGFAFLRRYRTPAAQAFPLEVSFEPKHAFGIVIGHAVPSGGGTFELDRSRLAASYRTWQELLTFFWDELRPDRSVQLVHGSDTRELRGFDAEQWKRMDARLEELPEIHPRIRPRIARLLGHMAAGLPPGSARDAAAERTLAYLPEDPGEYYELGNGAFALGFQDLPAAYACLVAARGRLGRGEIQGAHEALESYFDVLPARVDPAFDRASIPDVKSAAAIDGLDVRVESEGR